MKTLKDYEQKFKDKFFTTASAMGTYGVDEFGNAPIIKTDYYRCPNAMIVFYRHAITELISEMVGENRKTDDFRGTHTSVLEAGAMKIGYNQAKAEIRERIKTILK